MTLTEQTDRTTTLELNVGGMTCAACAGRVERALNRIDGVTAVVNYATETAVVASSGSLEADTAVAAVRKAGYDAELRVASDDEWTQRANATRITSLRRRLIVSAVLTVPLMDITLVLALVPGLRFPFWEALCVLLALPIVTWAAWPFHRATLRNLRHGGTSMDTLVSLGIVVSFGWAVITILLGTESAGYWIGYGPTPPGANAIYLDVAAGLTTFQLAGRYFEARSRRKAGDVLTALAALAPTTARVRRAESELDIAVDDLTVGETVIVRAGEIVPVDGRIVEGWASVDTSAMTGEPVPHELGAGDAVIGGSVNRDGLLVITATAVGSRTQLSQMAALAERAQETKARVQTLVDRIVRVFVPTVIAVAILVTAGWLLSGADAGHAISAGVAVLIIACPCALGLATPTALMVGVGRGAQLGILIKSQGALESSGSIDTVVLDKTGTLTTGTMLVSAMTVASGSDRRRALELAAGLEQNSEHPVAAAIRSYAAADIDEAAALRGVRIVPGRGVEAFDGDTWTAIGNPAWAAEVLGSAEVVEAATAAVVARGASPVVLFTAEAPVAVFGVADQLRASARAAVEALRREKLDVVLLTGDNEAAAREIGEAIGITDVRAGVLPADKARVIAELRAAGRKVAMVGDGINDAAALAEANLGLAVVNGTDVALKSADIILVRRDLRVIAEAVRLSRATLRTIRGNLFWAFGYNIAAIPLAAAGLLNPLIAAAAMSLSSILVVGNSLRLRNFGAGRR
ncbi:MULTISPECIES: heavy metal translocating P-type ATPase [unclassified Microbacterium]|uniref:heavy metal translocating P-type ATPase n=1 Tax=unclassified Microbacterium TaxID=2609290 RepID=UPI003862EFE5